MYDRIGDLDSARRAYDLATKRLTRSLKLHRTSNSFSMKHEFQNFNEFGRTLSDLLSYSDGLKFEKEMKRLKESLKMIERKSANESEAGVRQLGELLGFRSTRPDNDVGTGPDVLWLDEEKFQMIGLELKTKKINQQFIAKRRSAKD